MNAFKKETETERGESELFEYRAEHIVAMFDNVDPSIRKKQFEAAQLAEIEKMMQTTI